MRGPSMKWLGKKSVALVLRWINDGFLILFTLMFLGLIIFLIIRFSKPSYEVYDWPIELEQKSASHPVQTLAPDKEIIKITSDQYEISFKTQRDWGTIVYLLGGGILAFAWIIRFLWLIRQILKSMVNKNPFTRDNALRFRQIGFLIMGLPILMALRHLVTSWYLSAHFSFPGPSFSPIRTFLNHFDLGFIFLGLLILLLAEIFRMGTEFKEDSQSIV